MNYHAKQISALKLAVECLERERRARYAAGEAAWRQGIRPTEMKGEISGVQFSFAEDGHKKYLEYSQAISQLEDLQEILTDPGVVETLPLFTGISDE